MMMMMMIMCCVTIDERAANNMRGKWRPSQADKLCWQKVAAIHGEIF